MDNVKKFPIMIGHRGTPGPCPSWIPWELIAPYEGQAQENHDQTLERLAERGGLSPAEAFMVMHGRCWNMRESIEELTREACAFLDKLVRESQVARLVRERDDALLKLEEATKKGETLCCAYGDALNVLHGIKRQYVGLLDSKTDAEILRVLGLAKEKGLDKTPKCVMGCGKDVELDGHWCFNPCKPF